MDIELRQTYVVDASAIAKIFLLEEHGETVKDLIRLAIARKLTLMAPELIFNELGDVLRKRLHDGRYLNNIEQVLNLGVSTLPNDFMGIMDIAQLAQKYSMSYYDATYLALARELNAKLITADKRLCRSVLNSSDVILVSEMSVPKVGA